MPKAEVGKFRLSYVMIFVSKLETYFSRLTFLYFLTFFKVINNENNYTNELGLVLTLKSTRPKNLAGCGRMIQPIPIPIKNQTKQQPSATSLLPKAALMMESSPQNELYVPPDISFAQPKRNSLPEVKLQQD